MWSCKIDMVSAQIHRLPGTPHRYKMTETESPESPSALIVSSKRRRGAVDYRALHLEMFGPTDAVSNRTSKWAHSKCTCLVFDESQCDNATLIPLMFPFRPTT